MDTPGKRLEVINIISITTIIITMCHYYHHHPAIFNCKWCCIISSQSCFQSRGSIQARLPPTTSPSSQLSSVINHPRRVFRHGCQLHISHNHDHHQQDHDRRHHQDPPHPERVFRHGCHLQAPLVGLQLRDGHRLVPPGQVVATIIVIIFFKVIIIMVKMTKMFSNQHPHHRLQSTGTVPRCWRAVPPPYR